VPIIAHGLVGRADLPVPEGLFIAAAAVVLVLSFVALAGLWSRPRLQATGERRLFRLPRAVDAVLGAVGVLVFAICVYAGLAGTSQQADNLAPTMVYVAFWVGVPVASLLLGDIWRLLSPWRAIGRAAGAVARRVGGEGVSEPLPYPAWLGRRPAAVGILAFAVCELAWATARDPLPLAVLVLVYLVVMLVGMSLYGVEPWVRNADAFGVLFGMFAALSPLTREDGVLYARPPLVGATRITVVPGTTAVLLVAIGATAFDGAQGGPLFNDTVPHLQDAFRSLGFSQGTALELGFVAGLLAVCGLVALVWGLGVAGMPRVRGERPGRALVHSLVPILAAYVVAHYFSLLAYNGQDLLRLASDPLGDGSDLFGTADRAIDYGVVSATAIWYVQVGALVIGHVAGLVLAHDRALALYGSHRAASRSQVVMLVVMVMFTVLGLWLLSEANG
jgi:hypothetical protein